MPDRQVLQIALPVYNMMIKNNSTAGYTGAIFIFFAAFYSVLFNNEFQIALNTQVLVIIFFTFIFMLLHEFKFNPLLFHHSKFRYKPNIYKSALYRYFAYLSLSFIPYFIITNHYYFSTDAFYSSRLVYSVIFYTTLIAGYPYILFTLKHKGAIKFDYNDYGILFLLAIRHIKRRFEYAGAGSYIYNRRFKKLLLVMLVNFFFLSLMVQFSGNEFNQFSIALNKLISNYQTNSFFQNYHTVYLIIYHLIFTIDVGLAVIGYSVASRWLNNRTLSVDSTLQGWLFALFCYPPMNTGFSSQFVSYNFAYDPLLTPSEPVLMILMFLILCLFFVYVWATAALGFKFSNLTNRGVVNTGIYNYLRHPAYITKNLAWWLDNVYVFSNIWAITALATWNLIYFMRGITEERHLMKDGNYLSYQAKTKYRFIPFLY